MTFVAATNNFCKFGEIKRIMEPLGHKVLSLSEANVCVDVSETANTFSGNAEIKAAAVCGATNLPVIADDSGLEVDALNGAPGVYSARYAGENTSDSDRIQKLLNEMKNIPEEKRTARFVCAICCIFPDGKLIEAKGVCEGRIAWKPSESKNGFGYDPVFIEKSTGAAFSELSDFQKDAVSHRGRALEQFAERIRGIR